MICKESCKLSPGPCACRQMQRRLFPRVSRGSLRLIPLAVRRVTENGARKAATKMGAENSCGRLMQGTPPLVRNASMSLPCHPPAPTEDTCYDDLPLVFRCSSARGVHRKRCLPSCVHQVTVRQAIRTRSSGGKRAMRWSPKLHTADERNGAARYPTTQADRRHFWVEPRLTPRS